MIKREEADPKPPLQAPYEVTSLQHPPHQIAHLLQTYES